MLHLDCEDCDDDPFDAALQKFAVRRGLELLAQSGCKRMILDPQNLYDAQTPTKSMSLAPATLRNPSVRKWT